MQKHKLSLGWVIPGSIVLCIIAALMSLSIGNLNFSPAVLWKLLTGKITSGAPYNIFWYARVPRTLACLLAGAALSSAGAVLQNVLANKLASPSIIGVNAGAGFGVTLCCALGILSGWVVSIAAFTGSLLAVIIISFFSCRTSASRTTVILGGVALNSILNAFSEAITVLIPDVASLNIEFRVGGFSAVSYTRLLPASVLIVIALIVLMTLCNELDIVTLGDDTAQGVGLPVKQFRVLFLILSALLAGAAVSFTGLLGFVGLMVPHFIRRIFSSESRYLLPLCTFLGGAFVCLCDLAARWIFQPYELPVGILMSVLGGPVFVVLLIRGKRRFFND